MVQPSMKAVWRYAGMRPGALCVMIHGLLLMQSWPVNSLATQQQVKYCSLIALNWYNLPIGLCVVLSEFIIVSCIYIHTAVS